MTGGGSDTPQGSKGCVGNHVGVALAQACDAFTDRSTIPALKHPNGGDHNRIAPIIQQIAAESEKLLIRECVSSEADQLQASQTVLSARVL